MIRYGGGGRESMDLLGKVYESKMSGEKVKRAGNVTRGPKAKWQPQERKEFSLQSS
jgi:accessory colonization factor AcfC